MSKKPVSVDVLCVGHACFDMVFAVGHHPAVDEKAVASSLVTCGGGPAANAAVGVSRLGLCSAFCGYLGKDLFGQRCMAEFASAEVDTGLTATGIYPTPLSAILVKPDGRRTVINHRGDTPDLVQLPANGSALRARVLLMDGHQPQVSLLLTETLGNTAVTVLDAGSLHHGTRLLMERVDHLVASQNFARQYSGLTNDQRALDCLAEVCPSVVITRGEKGLVWKRKNAVSGSMPAFDIAAVDTTGAGDAFHAAFAAGIAWGFSWQHLLHFSCAVGALACLKQGARPALPSNSQVIDFLKRRKGDRELIEILARNTPP